MNRKAWSIIVAMLAAGMALGQGMDPKTLAAAQKAAKEKELENSRAVLQDQLRRFTETKGTITGRFVITQPAGNHFRASIEVRASDGRVEVDRVAFGEAGGWTHTNKTAEFKVEGVPVRPGAKYWIVVHATTCPLAHVFKPTPKSDVEGYWDPQECKTTPLTGKGADLSRIEVAFNQDNAADLGEIVVEPQRAADDAATPTPAQVAWGEAVNGVQIGLVPLGASEVWAGFQCPRHALQRHAMPSPQEKEKAVKTRCCELCGASKPWGATFVEGEPMRFEVHMRNTGDKGVRVGGVHHWFTFVFTPAGGGVPRQAIFTPQVPMAPPGGGELPGNGYLAFVEGVGGNSAYGSWRFEDARLNTDASLRPIPALPPGKYSVTARYGDRHPEHTPDEPCPFWHGTVTTGPVQVEIKPDDATARFLEAAKYAGFAAVAEVKALPQSGEKTKPAQLGIEWGDRLYAPEIARNELGDVTTLSLEDGPTAANPQLGDRILVTVDQQQVMILALSKRLDKSSVNGAKWISWSQSRQDALVADLAPGWHKGACPWCHRGADSDYPVCACRNGCEGKGCTQRQKQRGGCIVTAKKGGFCEHTVGPATPGVTFRLWPFDPKKAGLGAGLPFSRLKTGTDSLPLWIEVQNEKGETPEFQTPGGGARFDCCKTLFYLVEGPGLSAPTPAFHGDGGARARMMASSALQKGSATGRADLMADKLFATPGTYTIRAVAGRLVSNPLTVIVEPSPAAQREMTKPAERQAEVERERQIERERELKQRAMEERGQ